MQAGGHRAARMGRLQPPEGLPGADALAGPDVGVHGFVRRPQGRPVHDDDHAAPGEGAGERHLPAAGGEDLLRRAPGQVDAAMARRPALRTRGEPSRQRRSGRQRPDPPLTRGCPAWPGGHRATRVGTGRVGTGRAVLRPRGRASTGHRRGGPGAGLHHGGAGLLPLPEVAGRHPAEHSRRGDGDGCGCGGRCGDDGREGELDRHGPTVTGGCRPWCGAATGCGRWDVPSGCGRTAPGVPDSVAPPALVRAPCTGESPRHW